MSWKDEYPMLDQTEVSQNLLVTVKKFSNLRKTGGNINRDLRRQKLFKNPDLLERLIQENNLIEIGSNFGDEIYNPFQWRETSFYDALAREQAKLLDEEKKKEHEQSRKDKTQKKHFSREVAERDMKRRRTG